MLAKHTTVRAQNQVAYVWPQDLKGPHLKLTVANQVQNVPKAD